MASVDDFEHLARANRLVGYFGYGSLVNRATLGPGVVAAWPARLRGWRRTWRARPDMGPTPLAVLAPGPAPCLLSAHPDPGSAIDGLLVIDLADNLTSVDAREFRYHRRLIGVDALDFGGEIPALARRAEIPLHVYEARIEHPPVAGPSPILRSYLDTVMQGFLCEFGETGLSRFVAETEAFDRPVLEDREAPLYGRAVALSPGEIALFDAVLAPSRGRARD
ncbi:gamma-glutamylcyclotransferase family protein [Hoeflea sp.]|uniref:gamma-glutamylcyclotransferase family protein n=1 Tax=Hoeflea sp. TaxID=1940281 RepID=UPI0019BD514D|nr:gamma-glutamylcyclotransferase family protein [Hoeflea sp.]MBC7283114.1 gamma-glutamylcyclotransferase [Hoeflea sp.]